MPICSLRAPIYVRLVRIPIAESECVDMSARTYPPEIKTEPAIDTFGLVGRPRGLAALFTSVA